MIIIVVAPHPDDETLGCGGTILRYKSQGAEVHWLIATEINERIGFSSESVVSRKKEIEKVAKGFAFEAVHQLNFPTTRLDSIPMVEIVEGIARVFREVNPDTVYTVCGDDPHTDHKTVFEAVAACSKWFRFPSIKRVLAYETISETDISIAKGNSAFNPNIYVDISLFLENKLEIMKIYRSEMGEFPFPRSERAIRCQAAFRGVQAGFEAAEAFSLLKERIC